jgi:hypothetical protein
MNSTLIYRRSLVDGHCFPGKRHSFHKLANETYSYTATRLETLSRNLHVTLQQGIGANKAKGYPSVDELPLRFELILRGQRSVGL